MMPSCPTCPPVFYCTLLDREADRADCHRCYIGEVCAGIPSRLMLIPRHNAKPAHPVSSQQEGSKVLALLSAGLDGRARQAPAGSELQRTDLPVGSENGVTSGQRERDRGVAGTAPRWPHKPEDLVRLRAPRPSVRRSCRGGQGDCLREPGKGDDFHPSSSLFPTSSVLKSPPDSASSSKG